MGAVAPIHTGSAAAADPLQAPGVRWPLVSVIVTCYNYARYLEPCLRSIQRQTYRNFECVVVDDRSTDASAEVAERFIRQDSLEAQFRLVRREVNGGQMAAFKTGLGETRGAFVVYVDADDLLQENFLQGHLDVHLRAFPVAFTSSNQYQINERGELIGGVHPDLLAGGALMQAGARCLYAPAWVWATTSSMMFRRPVLEAILPDAAEDENFRRCADNYVCHFANLVGGSALIPEVLGGYRRHGENTFSKNPLIGTRAPTGDMRAHPTHRSLTAAIRRHILARRDLFIALHSEKGMTRMLSRVTTPWQAAAILARSALRIEPALPLRLALRLALFSTMKYARFWVARFLLKPPFAEIELTPLERADR